MRRHAAHALLRIDNEARTGYGSTQTAVVAVIAVAQTEGSVLPQRIAAQHAAVEFIAIAIVERCRVEIAAVEGSGIVTDRD